MRFKSLKEIMTADHDTGISNKQEIQFIRDDVTGRFYKFLILKLNYCYVSRFCSLLVLAIVIGIVIKVK